MKTAAISISSLEDILSSDDLKTTGAAMKSAETDHPLAAELRRVLDTRDASSIGDLARVTEHLMREMAFLKDATGGDKS